MWSTSEENKSHQILALLHTSSMRSNRSDNIANLILECVNKWVYTNTNLYQICQETKNRTHNPFISIIIHYYFLVFRCIMYIRNFRFSAEFLLPHRVFENFFIFQSFVLQYHSSERERSVRLEQTFFVDSCMPAKTRILWETSRMREDKDEQQQKSYAFNSAAANTTATDQ